MALVKLPFTKTIALESTKELKLPPNTAMSIHLTENYLKISADYKAVQHLGGEDYAKRRIFYELSLKRGSIKQLGIEEAEFDLTENPPKSSYSLVADERDLWIFAEDMLDEAIELKRLIENWNAGN